MDGRFVRWDNPPLFNEGTVQKPNMIRHHVGCIWNCRCWGEPVIPEITYDSGDKVILGDAGWTKESREAALEARRRKMKLKGASSFK